MLRDVSVVYLIAFNGHNIASEVLHNGARFSVLTCLVALLQWNAVYLVSIRPSLLSDPVVIPTCRWFPRPVRTAEFKYSLEIAG